MEPSLNLKSKNSRIHLAPINSSTKSSKIMITLNQKRFPTIFMFLSGKKLSLSLSTGKMKLSTLRYIEVTQVKVSNLWISLLLKLKICSLSSLIKKITKCNLNLLRNKYIILALQKRKMCLKWL